MKGFTGERANAKCFIRHNKFQRAVHANWIHFLRFSVSSGLVLLASCGFFSRSSTSSFGWLFIFEIWRVFVCATHTEFCSGAGSVERTIFVHECRFKYYRQLLQLLYFCFKRDVVDKLSLRIHLDGTENVINWATRLRLSFPVQW